MCAVSNASNDLKFIRDPSYLAVKMYVVPSQIKGEKSPGTLLSFSILS